MQVSGFIDQYGKNLGARVSESEKSTGEFQDDADKYFDGDVRQLAEHYSNKSDPVIVSGSESIEAFFVRNQVLIKAQQEFIQSTYSAYSHLLINPVEDIRSDAWNHYTYHIVLNSSAISIGIVVGLFALAVFELILFLLNMAFQTIIRSNKRELKGTSS